MYEIQNINQNLVVRYNEVIANIIQKANRNEILHLALLDTFKELLPEFDNSKIEVFVILFLKPIFDLTNESYTVRNFLDNEFIEAKKIYHNSLDNLINDLYTKNDDVSKNNLEYIDYIYELLEYDKVIELADDKRLFSINQINVYSQQHFKALQELELLLISKPPENNIDIATNTNKSYKDKTKFLEDILNKQSFYYGIDIEYIAKSNSCNLYKSGSGRNIYSPFVDYGDAYFLNNVLSAQRKDYEFYYDRGFRFNSQVNCIIQSYGYALSDVESILKRGNETRTVVQNTALKKEYLLKQE